MTENEIGTRVIEAAISVHRELGPGLLETVYGVILARELRECGLKCRPQEAGADLPATDGLQTRVPAELRRRCDEDRYYALCQRP